MRTTPIIACLLGPGNQVSRYRISLTIIVLQSINQGKPFNSEDSDKVLCKKIFFKNYEEFLASTCSDLNLQFNASNCTITKLYPKTHKWKKDSKKITSES